MGRVLEGGAAVGGSLPSLRKFFNRFKREELVGVLKSLATHTGDLGAAEWELPKGKLLSAALARMGPRLTYNEVAQVDMQYTQRHAGKKWVACRMVRGDAAAAHPPKREPGDLQRDLARHLAAFFDVHVHSAYHDGAVWSRLYVQDGVTAASQLTGTSNTIYLIHTPHSDQIFASSMKVAHRDYVSQAIVSSFGCGKLEMASLSARSVDVLKELTHFQHSQGPYSEYRQNWHDSNPLDREAPRKRRRTTEPATAALHENIVMEDVAAAEARRDATDAAFGGADPPQLELAEFQLDTKYHGPPELDLTGRFRARVKFEGPSIIAGLAQLVEAGAAAAPLPDILTGIHSSARNKFTVTED